MRVPRLLLVVPLASLCPVPLLAQTTASAPRDPQAVSTVQAAITALGGATAIGQTQSWTFQAVMQGGAANGNVTYTIDTQPSSFTIMTKNGTKRTVVLHSFFVTAVMSAILVKEFQDTNVSMQYQGPAVFDSKPVTMVALSTPPSPSFPDQVWSFDANGLPVRIEFRIPAELGSRASQPGVTELSDYRSVGGVLYPFRIVTRVWGSLPEIITVQSVTPSTIAPTTPTPGNTQAGDTL